MNDYKVKAQIAHDGSLTIRGLPFRPGDQVEVTIQSDDAQSGNGDRYPLRGKPIRYASPFSSVDEGNWDALR